MMRKSLLVGAAMAGDSHEDERDFVAAATQPRHDSADSTGAFGAFVLLRQ
jgi:hypothetical protein